MFGKIKTTMTLTEAGKILQEAFNRTSPFPPDFDAKTLGMRLVAILYGTKPELFDGKMGPRPHPLATAAAALAQGLSHRPQGFDAGVDLPMAIALGALLQSASANSPNYKFGGYDVRLLKMAEQTYWEHEAKTRDATDRMVGSFGL